MIWLFAIGGALAVLTIAYVSVARVVVEMGGLAPASTLDVSRAVDLIADELPDEVAGRLSHRDVGTIIGWQLDHFADEGLASEYGEEVAGEGARRVDGDVTADGDAAVDAIVARALAESDYEAVDVVCVLDAFMRHLVDIGAVGPPA